MENTKEIVAQIIRGFLPEENEISENDHANDFSLLGIDSEIFVGIIIAIEETFEIEIPSDMLMISRLNTIDKLVGTIRELCVENS